MIMKNEDYDHLVLADGTEQRILRIIGGPQLIDGVVRDTLRIEMPDSIASDMSWKLKDKNLTKKLKFKCKDGTQYDIGDYYCIFVSFNTETFKKIQKIGSVEEPKEESILVATLAQMTYEEVKKEKWVKSR